MRKFLNQGSIHLIPDADRINQSAIQIKAYQLFTLEHLTFPPIFYSLLCVAEYITGVLIFLIASKKSSLAIFKKILKKLAEGKVFFYLPSHWNGGYGGCKSVIFR